MKLNEAVAATYAAVGQEMSDLALEIICRDLKAYPVADVGVALSRCRKELKRIALVDILDRIPNGHPGPEEAWGIVAKAMSDERVSIVWTDQISEAFGSALNLQDDPVAARMAFKEVYTKLVSQARDEGKPIVWRASLGHDPYGRESVLLEAMEKGRLKSDYVQKLLPHRELPNPSIQALLEQKDPWDK
jgi:hypothetical protein